MKKRYKLLSLLLCSGIVTSAFPSSGTGATIDSIAFYNSKKAILDMRDYDEAYDTNHDGVVNVFDVIRENKEVFQEESYTDLKSQIHSLETQIEILTQKLSEKEDKTQAESDITEINSALSAKVDLQEGKQLSSNDYTNEEKLKLEVLSNYDDTSMKSDISEISSALSGKVDNQEGKQLSSNDYTDEEKNKLASLENYNDSDIKSEISNINSELSSINDAMSSKVDHQGGKQLSSNDYTDSDKEKLESLENYDDTKINEKIDSLVQTAYEEKKVVELSIQNKVDKEEGKQLSSNDFTDEEKQKLESLHNYDDSDIKNQLDNMVLSNKKWIVCGDSYSRGDFTGGIEPIIPTGKYSGKTAVYPFLIGNRTNMDIVMDFANNGSTLTQNDGSQVSMVLNYQNIPEDADYITFYFGINDKGWNRQIGDIDSNDTYTFCGAYNIILCWLIENRPNAHIGIIGTNASSVEYVEASKNIAQKYGLPYLDMNDYSSHAYCVNSIGTGMNESVKATRDSRLQVGNGNIHPNGKMHEIESYFIEEWLKTI